MSKCKTFIIVIYFLGVTLNNRQNVAYKNNEKLKMLVRCFNLN